MTTQVEEKDPVNTQEQTVNELSLTTNTDTVPLVEQPTDMVLQQRKLQSAGLPSEDINEALTKLFTGGPVMLVDQLSLQTINVVDTLLQKVLNELGIEKIDENTDITQLTEDANKKIIFLAKLWYLALSDPEVQEQMKLLSALLEEQIQPVLNTLTLALKEVNIQIEKETDKMEKIATRAVTRIGDAATDSMGTVIAGAPPPIGTAYAALSAIDNLLKMITETARSAGEVGLSTTNGVLELVNKVAPEQLEAINGVVDVALNAVNTYRSIQESIDKLNAQIAGAGQKPIEDAYNEKVYMTQKGLMDNLQERSAQQKAASAAALKDDGPEIEVPDDAEAASIADAKPITTPEDTQYRSKPSYSSTITKPKKGGKRRKTKKRRKRKKRNQKKRTRRRKK
jgi:hypothetical protein